MTQAQVTQVSVPMDWIDFGVGQPQLDNLPLEQLEAGANHRFQRKDRCILAYGSEKGNGQFRIALASFLGSEYGQPVDPDQAAR